MLRYLLGSNNPLKRKRGGDQDGNSDWIGASFGAHSGMETEKEEEKKLKQKRQTESFLSRLHMRGEKGFQGELRGGV